MINRYITYKNGSRSTEIQTGYHNKHECRKPGSEQQNVTENVTQGDTNLGHKSVVFFIGKVPNESRPDPTDIVSLSRMKKVAKKLNPTFRDYDNLTVDGLRGMAQELTNIITSMMDNCTVNCRPRIGGSNRAALIKDLMEQEDDVITRLKASDRLYKFVDSIKKGQSFDCKIDEERPPLGEIADTLTTKLKELYPGDSNEITRIVEKRFPLGANGYFGIIPTPNKIGNIMLETSNSGAQDYLGMSLKMTKLIFSQNTKLKNRMRDICVGCIHTGFFPEIWTIDQISFLYKNKGLRSDPTKYRPITIAPSLGKHVEKAVSSILASMDDTNAQNHAYTKNRSCTTAVMDVQAKLLEARLKWDPNLYWDRNLGAPKRSGKKLVQFISADDIASAFESVDHPAVIEAVRRGLYGYPVVNIHGLLKWYLSARKSTAVDRNTGENTNF